MLSCCIHTYIHTLTYICPIWVHIIEKSAVVSKNYGTVMFSETTLGFYSIPAGPNLAIRFEKSEGQKYCTSWNARDIPDMVTLKSCEDKSWTTTHMQTSFLVGCACAPTILISNNRCFAATVRLYEIKFYYPDEHAHNLGKVLFRAIQILWAFVAAIQAHYIFAVTTIINLFL